MSVLLAACNPPQPAAQHRAAPGPPPGVLAVKVQKTAHGFRLLRGGRPYYLRGAGGLQNYAQLRAAGGNTVRLWSADYAGPLLDEAQRQGLTVMLGLWLEPEDQHFTYYDPAQVAAQRARVRQQILRYRHHPALLMWSLGNEVEQTATGPRFCAALNELASLVHELDPYHPVTTAYAFDFVRRADELQRVAPNIDILSVNLYQALQYLPGLLSLSKWRGPYIVSEFGSTGYWEAKRTTWLAPFEQTSTAKADSVSKYYQKYVLADSARCLGGYAFYWGSKFEYTATWLSLFEPTGEKTALVDELHRLWRHRYPPNRAPRVAQLLLNGQLDTASVALRPGRYYPALVHATDPEGDSLTVRWELIPEMPPMALPDEVATPLDAVPGCVVRARGPQATIRAPRQPGPYRLFVRVFDGHGSVATANLPVLVLPARGPAPAVPYSAPISSD